MSEKKQPSIVLKPEILGDVFYFNYHPDDILKNFDEAYVWDLDKTYLDTQWGSFKELLRTAIEKAFQKKNVPGTATLVTALRTGWFENKGKTHFPLFFITASPPQIEPRIRQKFELDDILPLGCFFKDNLKNLRPKQFWRLTQQVGYKLQALLQLRLMLKDDVRQVLWGDDSEADATIYSLYSDLCSRRLPESELRAVLKSLRVLGDQLETIFWLLDRIPKNDPVEKIYINLATDTDAEYYAKFGRRVVPTYNTFQTALDLYKDQRLTSEQVVRVGLDMVMNFGFSKEELTTSFDDLVRRGLIGQTFVEQTVPLLFEHDLMIGDYKPSVPPCKDEEVPTGGGLYNEMQEPWIPEHIDYLRDYR